ncbi:beta-galactosidase, partial [Jannaschia sp. LMIT008]|uniref:beta-galactosidase n=1 Tax=Jannaschia maritima TaxID=3032585 RepID=UPI0028124215
MRGRGIRYSVRAAAFGIVAAWAAAWAAPVGADVDLGTLSVAPNPRLGLAFPGSLTRYYPLMADAGLGVVRISASWGRIEPREGRFDFSGLDDRIRALQASGLGPFVTFESTADWATDPATRGVKNARPRDMAQWGRFVAAVVARYDMDGRDDMPGLRAAVPYYQAANEWISETNGSGGWAGSTDQLVDYVRTAHDAVKAEDAAATFLMGGIAAFNLDVLLVAGDGRDIPVRQTWSATSETVLRRAD